MDLNEENLLKVDSEGRSLAYMAALFHVTRSVISGKLRRLRAKGHTTFDRQAVLVKSRAAKRQKVPRKGEAVKLAPPKRPNAQTIYKKHAQPMSKAEMNEMLRKAVENTK